MKIVKVILKVEEIVKFKYKFYCQEYITLEVEKMQQPDKFGCTHTAYVTIREEKPKKKSSKKTEGLSSLGELFCNLAEELFNLLGVRFHH